MVEQRRCYPLFKARANCSPQKLALYVSNVKRLASLLESGAMVFEVAGNVQAWPGEIISVLALSAEGKLSVMRYGFEL